MKRVFQLKGHAKEVDNTYRIIAQSIGMMVSGFFLLFVFGNALPDLIEGKGMDMAPVLLLLLVAISGFFLTWKSERMGTWIMLGSGLVMLIYFIVLGDYGMSALYGLPFIASAVLFLMHLNKHRELIKQNLH